MFFLSGLIWSQKFTVDIDRIEISDTLGSEIIFDFNVKNTSDSSLTLSFVRTTNQLPDAWTSSLCFNFCFAPHLDSIVTNAQFGSSPLSPLDSTNFSVHVFPQSVNGTAEIGIKILNHFDSNEYIEYQLTANTNVTSIKNDELIDNRYELSQNYPNPFNPSTVIRYNVPDRIGARSLPDRQTGSVDVQKHVSLIIYDILGGEITTLVNKRQGPGTYEVTFNGADYPSGVYFYQFTTEGYSETKKMIIGK